MAKKETKETRPVEEYLVERIKELESENKKLKFDLSNKTLELEHKNKVFEEINTKYHELYKVAKPFSEEFEIEDGENWYNLYFDGSYFKNLWYENSKNSEAEQHLVNFLNYVKENL